MLPEVRTKMPGSSEGELAWRLNIWSVSKYWEDMQYENIVTTPYVIDSDRLSAVETKPLEQSSDSHVDVTGQLDLLIKKVGLNISQLADLLKVGRQSIYKWRDGSSIHKKNLNRLDCLHSVFISWNKVLSLKLGSYLYKKIAGPLSLYDLLSAETINVEEAEIMAIKIRQLLSDARSRAEQRRKKLRDAGFKPASKEQKDKVLNNLIRRA